MASKEPDEKKHTAYHLVGRYQTYWYFGGNCTKIIGFGTCNKILVYIHMLVDMQVKNSNSTFIHTHLTLAPIHICLIIPCAMKEKVSVRIVITPYLAANVSRNLIF